MIQRVFRQLERRTAGSRAGQHSKRFLLMPLLPELVRALDEQSVELACPRGSPRGDRSEAGEERPDRAGKIAGIVPLQGEVGRMSRRLQVVSVGSTVGTDVLP